ncbi:MAG: ArsR/SmtB family transcription factor [Polymorphobacter sp.]
MESQASLVAVERLAALAQPHRLAAFRLLVEAGPAGLPAGEIGVRLDMPASTLSFHLAHLRRAGLVSQRRDGRSLIYVADFDAMNVLVGYLTENCCSGASCTPAETLERKVA